METNILDASQKKINIGLLGIGLFLGVILCAVAWVSTTMASEPSGCDKARFALSMAYESFDTQKSRLGSIMKASGEMIAEIEAMQKDLHKTAQEFDLGK